MVGWVTPVVSIIVGIGALHATIKMNQPKIDRFFMAFFRDLGRYKARKRRMEGRGNSLMTVLMQKDDPLEDLKDLHDEDESNIVWYTADELYEFGDGTEGRPILISLFGRVYDVSKGKRYYGETGTYWMFAGHDVTYSLSTGCKTEACVEKSASELTEKQLEEGKRWLSFFHMHDKYPFMGKLEGNHINILMDELVDQNLRMTADGELIAPFN
jgi:predicted heme/steroid binding protein